MRKEARGFFVRLPPLRRRGPAGRGRGSSERGAVRRSSRCRGAAWAVIIVMTIFVMIIIMIIIMIIWY
jgi:hypothetical protein